MDDKISFLVERARAAALGAYAPYSGFSVGCAIESVDGEIAVGANMENACYRLGVCGEIAALTAVQQAFGLDRIARIAVVGGHVDGNGELAGTGIVTPCGGCRQSILEAAHLSDRDLEVIASNGDGTETRVGRISSLIPDGFGPANLKDDRIEPRIDAYRARSDAFNELKRRLSRPVSENEAPET